MNSVEIRLEPNELPGQMGAMRVWLDEQGYESSGFSCSDGEHGMQVRLLFKAASQAQAFAERFGGRANAEPRLEGVGLTPGLSPAGVIG
ncbi:MAG: hypothetical protein ACJ8AH_00320 [Stellaceae bacterium]|jgi:hypothetical protein